METMEELQTLVERIGEETDRLDEVLIYLPPVTYEGKLELTGRPLSSMAVRTVQAARFSPIRSR